MTPPVFAATHAAATDDVLTLHRSDTGRSTRLTATGELDSCTAPTLAAVLEDVLGQHREVTVDLGAVFFLDAAGVHVLAAAARHSAAVGSRLGLIASRPAVMRPLRMAGLLRLLETADASSGRYEAA